MRKSIKRAAALFAAAVLLVPQSASFAATDGAGELDAAVSAAMKYEKREKVKVLVLNTKNVLIKIINVSYGGTNSATINPKDILAEPIKMGAPKIILVHNHPSGDPTPSQEDIETTKRLYNAAALLGIELLDHIVIGNERYTSVFSIGGLR